MGLLGACLCVAAVGEKPKLEKVESVPALTAPPMFVGGRVATVASSMGGAFASEYLAQWPGTYFETAFNGHEVFFRVGANHAIFHVVVDGRAPLVLTNPAAGVYLLSGLDKKEHTVRVQIVTETQGAPNAFGGFGITAGEEDGELTKRARQMEFIGDSHTVGYGNASPKRECMGEEIWSKTDTSQAFGALTAEHYGADYQVDAISGRGIVRNYNGGAGDVVPVAYPYVLFDKKQVYADAGWKPQVIVIALGTNDFSTPLNPGETWKTREELHADYEATYVRFLKSLRAQHPGAYFVLWATELADGEIASEEKKVVAQARAQGETRIGFVPVDQLAFTGCQYHPSLADDRTIAERLERFIDATPGIWEGK
jgi:lysophospholipase L1-like esterase